MWYDIPDCCKNCIRLDSDYSEWHETTYWYCRLNLFFPTKKQTCKKQKPAQAEVEAK